MLGTVIYIHDPKNNEDSPYSQEVHSLVGKNEMNKMSFKSGISVAPSTECLSTNSV